ncbi:DUF4190 domain-containing protein [Mycobacterium shimoidei]|uniref:DUF4190 domain-containing protein n=1 Tax=Mycobacterium shimoidei TaxID=29313 RepID=UPI0008486AE5|nr:DUF4190 domain-containing protein [Mycobacterium shimoidei]MCV7257472.1 DUF4190 domain-containing protein [Mycobacterium shimoidei]ODR13950.1 hypothetical protein BHQ16_07910 [Mycobacterium shimoidei]ORW77535.1 hypothetical protein AWC26_18945 [Mycobacterium shimoidei]
MAGPDQPFHNFGGEQYPRWDNPPAPVDPPAPLDYPDYPPPQPPYGYPAGPYPGSGGYPAYPGYGGHGGYGGYGGYGYADPYNPYRPPPAGTNSMAIASLMTSIMGFPLVFLCYIGVAGWIAGIVFGIVALNQISETSQPGRGLAIAGISIGAVALVLSVMAWIIFVLMIRTAT